jgi:hypothetical protein
MAATGDISCLRCEFHNIDVPPQVAAMGRSYISILR